MEGNERRSAHHKEVARRIAIDQTEAENRYNNPDVGEDETISFNVTLRKKNYRELKGCAAKLRESRSETIYKAIGFLHEKLFGSRLPFADESGAKTKGEEAQSPEEPAADGQEGEPKAPEGTKFDGMAEKFFGAFPARKCNPAYVTKWFREHQPSEETFENLMAELEKEKKSGAGPWLDPNQGAGPICWLDQHFKDDTDEPDF